MFTNFTLVQRALNLRIYRSALTMLSLGALCLLAACAKPVIHAPNTLAPVSQAEATWQAYEQYSKITQDYRAPYRISASLRYESQGKGHRLLAYMWSNDTLNSNENQSTASPLRLDIMAGIGATVAQVREDANSFVAYSPNENKAYYHNGSRKPLFSLGVPVPFSIADVTSLVLGRFSMLFGTTFNTEEGHLPTLQAESDIAYSLLPQGQLVLSQEGLVLQWCEQNPTSTGKKRGWVLDIAYTEAQNSEPTSMQTPSQLPLPRKLTFTYYGPNTVEHTAVILIKERDYPEKPFAPEQIELQIPHGTVFYPLQNGQ